MQHSEFLKLKEGDLIHSKYDPTLSGFVVKVERFREVTGMLISKSRTRYFKGPRIITEITVETRGVSGRRYLRYVNDDRDGYKDIEKFM